MNPPYLYEEIKIGQHDHIAIEVVTRGDGLAWLTNTSLSTGIDASTCRELAAVLERAADTLEGKMPGVPAPLTGPASAFISGARPADSELDRIIAEREAQVARDAADIARQINENAGAFWDRKISYEAFTAKAKELWKLAGRDGPTLCAVTDIIHGKLPPAA